MTGNVQTRAERALRGLVLAILFLVTPRTDAVQPIGILHIKVALVNGERQSTAVQRHALLISDNPASAPPRRVLTSIDGTVDVRLAPGNYTVESDRPVAFEGKAYQWTVIVDIVAGHDAVLELTAKNATIEAITSSTPTDAVPMQVDTSGLLARRQESVVAIWTPTTHGSATVVNANGLLVTSQRVIGIATAVEVQLTPSVKVAAIILASDPVRDVAVLRIDPAIAATVPALALDCAQAPPSVAEGQEIFAIEAPLSRRKGTTSGTVSRVGGNVIGSDLAPASGGAGGPVFTESGVVVGLVSISDEKVDSKNQETPVVRIGDVCSVVAMAETKMKDTAPPSAAHLPVEPVKPFLADARTGAMPRGGSFNPYQIAAADFDIAFITPSQVDAAQNQSFSNWSEYVADKPPVLLVRATPKLVEGFWTKGGRAAAMTQGVALPAFTHPKSGFSRMRAFCGEAEITPIHPFKLEQRLSANDLIYEGLYVFDPGAFPPSCGSVKLMLYSEKEPGKPDTQVVDPKVVQQIWQDFAPYRATK